MSDAFDTPAQPTTDQPQPAAQPQTQGDAFDEAPKDKTPPPTKTNQPTESPYNWFERAEGAVVKHIPFGEDNKVLNWVNKNVVQPPARMGKEAGNILVQKGLSDIGEGLHSGENVPEYAQGNEPTYWRMQLEKEHPGLSGVASSVLDTIGNIGGNPTNWPLMGAAAAKSALLTTFTKAFGVQMAKDTLGEADDLWNNWGKMDTETKYRRVTDLLTHAYFSKKSLEHGATPPKEGPQPKPNQRVLGEAPTTKTIAGVETPVSTQHAESVSGDRNQPVTATAAGLHELKEFQRNETAPPATAAMHSVLGQSAEDLINQHDATIEGTERPDEVAGTNQPSKYESIDDAANALNEKARSTTYAKADEISEREQQEHAQRVQSAVATQKAGIDHFNELVDEHNSQLAEGEQPMEHQSFDPSKVEREMEPARPKTYGELKGALDRANADMNSPDAQVREEAVDNREKAEKQLDGWFKQHNDEISPEEYTSAKKLVYAGARFQEVANGLRAGVENDNLTGNKLRSIIASIDNRMIKRGQEPGAFRRLVGDQVYQNWRDVARLFDPIQGAPAGALNYGKLAMHYIAHHMFGPLGFVGKMGAHWLMDKVLSSPEWGNWFKDMSDAVRAKAAKGRDIPIDLLQKFKTMYENSRFGGEEGAAGAAIDKRNVGEPTPAKFGRSGVGDAFDQPDEEAEKLKALAQPTRDTDLMSQARTKLGPDASLSAVAQEAAKMAKDYSGEERRSTRRAPMNATELEAAIKGRKAVQTPFDDKRDPAMEAIRQEFSGPRQLTMEPSESGFPEAKVTPETPAFAPAVDKPESEIGTRYPKSVGVSGENNPDQMPDMTAMDQAEKAAPGYFDKLVESMRGYKGNNGLPLEDTGKSSRDVVNGVVKHLADNLKWLHDSTPESIRGISKQWYDTAQRMTGEMADKYGISHEKMAAVTAALSPKNGWDNNVGMADRLVDTWKNSREHPWDTEMEKSLNKVTSNPKLKPAFRQTLNSIRGLKYDELTAKSPEALFAKKGLWIRLYDEAHRSKQTPVYAPDGTIRGHQTLAWGMPDPAAKAIAILEGPDTTQHINDMMGEKNKIRSFYNNIINPNSPRGHVTIDTHAVNADMLKPMGSDDEEVLHNFGGAPGHAETGLGGTYAVHAEAYRQAAKALGILPRELQSITWEAVRTLFGESKKTPELKAEVNDIWNRYKGQAGTQAPGGAFESRPVKKSLDINQVRDEILKAAKGFDRPVWSPEVQQTSRPTSPASEAGISGIQNQTASLGEGDNKITADVNPPELTPDVMKWRGQEQPRLKRQPNGRVDYSGLGDIADYLNANVTPEDMLNSTAHELAHAFVQHQLGVPTDEIKIGLGHRAMRRGVKVEGGSKSSSNGISGGHVDPGHAWTNHLKAAHESGDPDAPRQVLQDYTTQLMAGRAMEELLGTKFRDVEAHAHADTNMAKNTLKKSGVPSYLHSSLLRSATEKAKTILSQHMDVLRHMTQQAVNHYGGKRIDAETFHKYRQGGVYEK